MILLLMTTYSLTPPHTHTPEGLGLFCFILSQHFTINISKHRKMDRIVRYICMHYCLDSPTNILLYLLPYLSLHQF